MFRAVRRALTGARARFGFRLVHFSVQRDHLHLLAEASDRRALSRGMQGLSIRVAKAVNRRLGRRGAVFADRYHARALKTPREARFGPPLRALERQEARARQLAVPCGLRRCPVVGALVRGVEPPAGARVRSGGAGFGWRGAGGSRQNLATACRFQACRAAGSGRRASARRLAGEPSSSARDAALLAANKSAQVDIERKRGKKSEPGAPSAMISVFELEQIFPQGLPSAVRAAVHATRSTAVVVRSSAPLKRARPCHASHARAQSVSGHHPASYRACVHWKREADGEGRRATVSSSSLRAFFR